MKRDLVGSLSSPSGDGDVQRNLYRAAPRCHDLPSPPTAGAKTISTRCISRIVRAPSAAIDWRSAPMRFCFPTLTVAGANRIFSSDPAV
jgi:hypothetical protein